ncbi:hypothetical protein EV360DRAFT_44572, partial [Lentinula raphanica]
LSPSPIIEKIIAFLDVGDLLSLRLTCQTAHNYVTDLGVRAHRIGRILSPFFNDDEIDQFRYLQASTGFIISGSSALQFFTRECYDTEHHQSDLDTYCFLSRCDDVAAWLMENNYEYVPRHYQLPSFTDDWNKIKQKSADVDEVDTHEYPERSFVAVWDFTRNNRKIQLIAVKGSLVGSILAFHSTCVMNIITHCAAYCLFPKTTLLDRVSFPLNDRLDDIEALTISQKWNERGYRFLPCPSVKDILSLSSGLSFRRYRWVGDMACLMIPLDPHPCQKTIDTVKTNSFSVRYRKTKMFLDSCFFQPDTTDPGIVVASREHRRLLQKYPSYKGSVNRGLLS